MMVCDIHWLLTISLYLLTCNAGVTMGRGPQEVEVKELKSCGPTNHMTKYEVTPWPILTAGKPVNATLTFTPEVDVLFSSIQYELISLPDRQVLGRGIDEMADPLLSGLSAGETYHWKYFGLWKSFPRVIKGEFRGKCEFYNQDQIVWLCFEGVFTIY